MGWFNDMEESDDEVLELFAVSNGLLAHKDEDNADNDVVGDVLGVLDDGVGKEELNSDVLEAVGGKEESNTFPFNGITDLDGGLVLVALVEHLLALLNQSEEISLDLEVVVLNGSKGTCLSSSTLASISGLICLKRSKNRTTGSKRLPMIGRLRANPVTQLTGRFNVPTSSFSS